jgi:hypothetical protein
MPGDLFVDKSRYVVTFIVALKGDRLWTMSILGKNHSNAMLMSCFEQVISSIWYNDQVRICS